MRHNHTSTKTQEKATTNNERKREKISFINKNKNQHDRKKITAIELYCQNEMQIAKVCKLQEFIVQTNIVQHFIHMYL